jgi:6-phosphogluconolactonase
MPFPENGVTAGVIVEVLEDHDAVARAGARALAACAEAAVARRGIFTMALSGGRTPWAMLAELGSYELPWDRIHVFQVDERVAPPGDPDRNLAGIAVSLLRSPGLPRENVHAMPVDAPDLEAAARRYAAELASVCGRPPVLDVVHLGLGDDGHTASWPPGDSVAAVTDADVGVSGIYRGRRRMTLTPPAVNRSRVVLWMVTGPDKARVLDRMRAGDPTLPASLVRSERSLVLADQSAACEEPHAQ